MAALLIRRARPEEVPVIMEIMTRSHRAMDNPSAYITDDMPYVARHIRDQGFILLALMDEAPAGFLMVDFPPAGPENPGAALGLSPAAQAAVAAMDSAAVLPEYQGRGLMKQLLQTAVALTEADHPYLLGTVAPDNAPSRQSFAACGFIPLKTMRKRGSLTRLLMGKIHEGALL